jgi:hypothetical protein
MARIRALALCLAVLAASLGATAVHARDDDVRREGACDQGSEWRLRVRRETPTTLRVRYILATDDSGHTWSIFLSMNGSRLFAGERTTNADGYIRVSRYPSDRDGDDQIRASANDQVTGESCSGGLTYRS